MHRAPYLAGNANVPWNGLQTAMFRQAMAATWARAYLPLLAPASRDLYAWAINNHISPAAACQRPLTAGVSRRA